MNGRKIRTPRSPGGESLRKIAVSTALLTLAACSGGEQDSPDALQNIPELAAAQAGEINAEKDVATTRAGDTIVVPILSNDTVSPGTRFRLEGSPQNGSARLLDTGAVEYTPNTDFEGTDIVEYVLVDAEGNESHGSLYIAVVCADCHIGDTSALTAEGMPYCLSESSDPDGDGFGWEDNATCAVPDLAAAFSGLEAKPDEIELAAGETKAFNPLRNDSIADRSKVQMLIESEPVEGTIDAIDGGMIVYTAPENYLGTDALIYSISDHTGETSVASVEFQITCDSCVDYQAVRVSWAANPESEGVEGYKVLFGNDENPLTSVEISDVKVTDGETPTVVFDLAEDLSLASHEGGCFMIQAYRGNETSEASDAACFNKSS